MSISICVAQQDIDGFIEKFVQDMQQSEELKDFVLIPDSLKSTELMINYVLVERYTVERIQGKGYVLHVDPGIGKYCVHLTLEVLVLENGSIKLRSGNAVYNEILRKYILDPWRTHANTCS